MNNADNNEQVVNNFSAPEERKPIGFERNTNIFAEHSRDAKVFRDAFNNVSILHDRYHHIRDFIWFLSYKAKHSDARIELAVWEENDIGWLMNDDEFEVYSFLSNYSLYQTQAVRFANKDLSYSARSANAVLGLYSEFGEFVGVIRSILFKGKDYNQDRLHDELGDFMWYFAYWNAVNGISMNYGIYNDYNRVLKTPPYVENILRDDTKYFDAERCNIIMQCINSIFGLMTNLYSFNIGESAIVAEKIYWNGQVIRVGRAETYIYNQESKLTRREYEIFGLNVEISVKIMECIKVLASVLGLSVKTAMGNNLKKLQGRYPDGSFIPDSVIKPD